VPVADLPLRLDVAARSDPGLERESNQDSFLVVEPAAKAAWALLAVCDGMGGAAGGDVASQLAVDVLRDVMISGAAPPTRDALGRRLLLGVEEAGRRIFASARKNRQLSGMGTTATACALTGDALYIAQVGDSRAYLFREGRLSRLTRDQTLATLMMEQGQLAPEDVETCGFGHVILQAVGTAERVDVDLTRLAIAAGDVLLVCSDGLHGPVKDDAIRAILCLEPSPAAACDALIALALDAGGPDNVTVLVARVSGNALRPPSGPPSPEKARLDEDPTVGAAPIKVTVDAEETGRSPPPMDEDAALGVIARFAAFFRRRRGRRAVEG
jgi:protein phosphatase